MSKQAPWSHSDIPDLTGKVAIVTGGTSGIGYETALALVKAGAEVTITGRNVSKGNQAVECIRAEIPEGKVSFTSVDFGGLMVVAEFARKFNARNKPLDILVNNAGRLAPAVRETDPEGNEIVFVTNHLAPFLLTGMLLPSLRKSSAPRVINLSSGMAAYATMDFDDIHFQRRSYILHNVYAQSKLANLMFTFELQRRSEENGWGITSIAVHPGLVKTEMTKSDSGSSLFQKIVGVTLLPWFGQEPWEGSSSSLFAATSPEAKGGEFYGPNGLGGMRGTVTTLSVPAAARNVDKGKELWELSEKLTSFKWE